MCNDFGNRVTYQEYVDAFEQQNLRVIFPPPDKAPNYPPVEEIWPRDEAPVVRPVEGGVEIAPMRWGLRPGRPKAPVVINMRSEGRRFDRGRLLVPVSHFFEFTGSGSPKTRWRFTLRGAAWFCFAGLAGRGEGDAPAFTLLTTAPSPEVAPYHDRQPVILLPELWAGWLDHDQPAGDFLRPTPAGLIEVAEAPRQTADGEISTPKTARSAQPNSDRS
jgi:putative SOS response-associated peptidase YedK